MKNIFILSIVMISSCTRVPEYLFNEEKIVNKNIFKAKTIKITNEKNEPIRFSYKINDFPLNTANILEQIDSISKYYNLSEVEAAWIYVNQVTRHANSYISNNWQHDVYLFTNSIGKGFCDDRASLLAQLWRDLGYQSKVYGISGHVICEVYENGKWKMYDPDMLAAFYNNNHQIASIKELENDSSLFNNRITVPPQLNIEIEPYQERYIQFFTSKSNNKESTEWFIDIIPEISKTYLLPPKSTFEIISGKNFNLGKLTLSKKSLGDVYIPLVPYFAEGNFKIQIEDSIYAMNNIDSLFFKKINESSFKKIKIIDVNKHGTIYYHINSNLEIFKHEFNTFTIDSEDSQYIKTHFSNIKI